MIIKVIIVARSIFNISLRMNGFKPAIIAFSIPIKPAKWMIPHENIIKAPIKTAKEILNIFFLNKSLEK